MRFMLLVKATRHFEAGMKPAREVAEAMTMYNEKMTEAGVLLAVVGLRPSAEGLRMAFPVPGGEPNVMPGPFEVTKGLVERIMLIDVKSVEEAYLWALRMPDPHGYGEGEIELRQLCEAEEQMPMPIQDSNRSAMEAELREHIGMLKKRRLTD